MPIPGPQLFELALACDWAAKDQRNMVMFDDGRVAIHISKRGAIEVRLSGIARTQLALDEWVRACTERSKVGSVSCSTKGNGPYVIRFAPTKPS